MKSEKWQVQVVPFWADTDKMKRDLTNLKNDREYLGTLYVGNKQTGSLGQINLNYDYKMIISAFHWKP